MICRECGRPLTANEWLHYDDRCEDCEVAWLERVEAWRKGAPDPELDKQFDAPSETRH